MMGGVEGPATLLDRASMGVMAGPTALRLPPSQDMSGNAGRRARSGTSTTSRVPRCIVGSRASATAAPRKPPATAPLSGTSRSSCASATDSWRWRWTFQNRRRRYSHEGRRDTGQRLPLSDIGAVQDTGRSPLRLLLDDRASRSRAGGPDRRRRARGPARRP